MADEIAGGGAGGNGGPQPPTFTLLPPQPGALAVSDTAFEEFYKALDDFAPTARGAAARALWVHQLAPGRVL